MEVLKVSIDSVIPSNQVNQVRTEPIIPLRRKLTRLFHLNLPQALLQQVVCQQKLRTCRYHNINGQVYHELQRENLDQCL